MLDNKILYACKEHIEVALDDFINEEEKAPIMLEMSEDTNEACNYCEQKAKYKVLE